MSYSVLVEPADDQKRAFARWCLAQEPRIETASASGSEVTDDLFKQIPEALLVGAYIDGTLYRHVPEPEPTPEPLPVRRTRKAKTEVTE